MNAKEKENESYVWWMCGETISMLKIRKEIECYDKVMELRPNKNKMKEDVIANLSDNLIMLSEKLNAQERKREKQKSNRLKIFKKII